MFVFVLVLLLLLLSCEIAVVECYRPVVLLHGLLASKEAMSHAEKWIKADFNGIYVHNVEIGNGRDDSLFMNINQQVAEFARHVKADPKLANGFNLIGHSQGGLITRAYIERFNDPPVHNWISWAGPQAGVYGVPDLNAYCSPVDCPWLDDLFSIFDDPNTNVLGKGIQSLLSFAAYWHDPFHQKEFAKDNIFLADLQNYARNATYKRNFSSLNKALLIYSTTGEFWEFCFIFLFNHAG
jgi:palmitoyl-protein thioesterase